MLPEPVDDSGVFQLPSEVEEVLASLTDEGRKDFIAKLLGALRTTQSERDLRPAMEVIEGWYKTMLFVRTTSLEDEETLQADVNEIVERVEAGEEGQTFDELRESLGLPEPRRRRSA